MQSFEYKFYTRNKIKLERKQKIKHDVRTCIFSFLDVDLVLRDKL